MAAAESAEGLRAKVQALEWYHTLELAPGLETPGWFDLRPVLGGFPLPGSLTGERCLDVGTFDGFWAFEMERRGAAEVVAIDVLDPARWDWPAGSEMATRAAIGERKARGAGFELAHRALGSTVERRELSVYDLDPAEVGRFDLVYVGSLLLHLRDPVGALERVRAVCRGRLVLCDAVDAGLARLYRRPAARLDGLGRPWWWKPNPRGLARMVEAAGFDLEGPPRLVRLPAGAAHPRPRELNARQLASRAGRELVTTATRGDPHAVVVGEPARLV
jgi:tRNA (mo5U34)-methyltransferase